MKIPSAAWRNRQRTEFMALLALAFLVRIAAAAWLPNVHHPDEVFQTLEPATRLISGTGIVSWEWRDGIRSWLLPGFLSGLMTLFGVFTDSRGAILLSIAATLSLLSLSVVAVGYLVGKRHYGHEGGLFVGGFCAVWPDLVYFAPKTLTEVVAAHVLIVAAFLALKEGERREDAPAKRFIVLGLLLGLAFALRFHLAPAMLVVAAWACRTAWRSRWLPLLAGAVIPLLVVGLIDFYTWGTPFQSIWKNFWVNVVEGRSHHYGTSPFYYYFMEALGSWDAAVFVIAAMFLIGARRIPLFAAIPVVIWLSHMSLAHKEMRFLFPATPFILIVAGIGTLRVATSLGKERPTAGRAALTSAAAWSVITLAVSFSHNFRPHWTRSANILAAQAAVREEPSLCGLGIIGISWARTGGYAHLGRDVPIYLHLQPNKDPRYRNLPRIDSNALQTFNYAIAPARLRLGVPFQVERCWDGLCLQRREGGCKAGGPAEANQHLIRMNE